MNEQSLNAKLLRAIYLHPQNHRYRYTEDANNAFLEILFRSLTADRQDYLALLFPNGFPSSFTLKDVQNVQEEAEYTEAARGHACGHIFKAGEASYHCLACTDDATAVLCARCFNSSDHEGHQVHISISSGNTGCCDCGDDEAWKRPVKCAIHTDSGEKAAHPEPVSTLPEDLQHSISRTISAVLNFFCDVISCSPENLRITKTIELIEHDQRSSRLDPEAYFVHPHIDLETDPEYCLVIWNDEKHTVKEVKQQVARACRERERFGEAKAHEANDIGRSIVRYSRDLPHLMRMAKIIEEIKITATIRSSRDTFYEQMCGTIVDWLSDIAGSSIAGDSHILRRVICKEMLSDWVQGSQAWNARVGLSQLDDHEQDETRAYREWARTFLSDPIHFAIQRALAAGDDDDDDGDLDDMDDGPVLDLDADDDMDETGQEMAEIVLGGAILEELEDHNHDVEQTTDADVTDEADEMDTDGDGEYIDAHERMDTDTDTHSPLPPPPLPPPPPIITQTTPRAVNGALMIPDPMRQAGEAVPNPNYMNVPTNAAPPPKSPTNIAPPHWLVASGKQKEAPKSIPSYEDLKRNIRIDSMILFDLRLWKITRIKLRDLYINTVVNIPEFKRILGLRFSGIYTTLAQLYLVADREPDHSIINLSLQMLTTPSITQEVVESSNFLTKLLAILYTFLTTRQVGFPTDVDPSATLGFESGSVTNRRLCHFFSDLRYFLISPFVQAKIRTERQFLFQFLDLVTLSQGICPNTRAIGDHVEYETDSWISASILTREINKLCKQFSESYQVTSGTPEPLFEAIMQTAVITMVNSVGLERRRFEGSEIKDLVRFHEIGPFLNNAAGIYRVVEYEVAGGYLSFHHPLHYVLSWLLECGKDHSEAVSTLKEAAQSVFSRLQSSQLGSRDVTLKTILQNSEDTLLSLFDFPLRVSAWLAQMKANMWVRNGMSLRHQMVQYKGVNYRDIGHHRDLFLLQTALVACDPSRVLASMIDRFGLTRWMSGDYSSGNECDDGQMLDLAEDMTYLLINLLSDRDNLVTQCDDPESQLVSVRKDVAHTLCSKPLPYSELIGRLTERAQEHEKLQEVLDSMTRYRAPEGLHDNGLFELKEEYLQELDPYNSHFSKNQRDEAENIYRIWMAKKLKKQPEDIILEPKLRPIQSEPYKDLPKVLSTPLLANVLHKALAYVAHHYKSRTGISNSRAESFLHVALQLALIATLEDKSDELSMTGEQASFVHNALSLRLSDGADHVNTIVDYLHTVWTMEDFSSCQSKIRHILRLFNQKRPNGFVMATKHLDFPSGRFDTASPANIESEVEAKKKKASERASRVLAQFQQQQQSFMEKQGSFDWGEDDMDESDEELPSSTETRPWKYQTGLCIQCREDTSDERLYGTFAMISDAHILRTTDETDPEYFEEILATPPSLDRNLDHLRPFGIAGKNHSRMTRLTSDGRALETDFQGLAKGYDPRCILKGPVSTSCGHIMHHDCFETYCETTKRRHLQQVARNHPERIELKEFVCPLCKALANMFLPILWKYTDQSYPGVLRELQSFDEFLERDVIILDATAPRTVVFYEEEQALHRKCVSTFNNNSMASAIAQFNSSTSGTTSGGPGVLTELRVIYSGLHEPLELAAKSQAVSDDEPNLDCFDILVETLANSVAAVEIAHRGREAEFGLSLTSGIPQQTLNHLQVLSATLRAYAAVYALAIPEMPSSFRLACSESWRQVIGPALSLSQDNRCLLRRDAFQIFVEISLTTCPVLNLSYRHTLHLCLISELLRVGLVCIFQGNSFLQAALQFRKEGEEVAPNELRSVRMLVQHIWDQASTDNAVAMENIRALQNVDWVAGGLYRLFKCYALAFLRKATILFHTTHGIDYPNSVGTEAGLPELERLLHLLQLPSLVETMVLFDEFSPSPIKKKAAAWIGDLGLERKLGIRLLHPTPLELLGLPLYFDTLMEETHRHRCPTTGKELQEPAICLFCGAIFCSQAYCCTNKDHQGGCNQHVEQCSKPIGIFLFIRKCQILLLHVVRKPIARGESGRLSSMGNSFLANSVPISHGSFFPAPYLTKHGENDSQFRSKHQLILSRKRYDKLLRDTWLMVNSSVWSTVARKLESDSNAGGWETM